MAGRQILPVLDGLDELDKPDETAPGPRAEDEARHDGRGSDARSRAAALLEELNDWYDGQDSAPVVVTTRPGCLGRIDRHGPLLGHARTIRIRPLTSEQITDYIGERYRDSPRLRGTWQPVLDTLGHPAGEAVRDLLSTPWRLMLAVTAFEDDPALAAHLTLPQAAASDEPESIPATRADLEELLLASYIPAATRLTPRRSRFRAVKRGGEHYRPYLVHHWLAHLARHLDRQARYAADHRPPPGMSPVDIVPHLLWPIGGWYLPRLLHAAAVLITLAPTAAILWFAITDGQFARITGIVLAALLGCACVGCVAAAAGRFWPQPAITGRAEASLRGRLAHASGLALRLALVLGSGFVFGLVLTLAIAGEIGLDIEIAFLLVLTLIFGLAAGLPGRRRRWEHAAGPPSPHQPVHDDLLLVLMLGLLLMFVLGQLFVLPPAFSYAYEVWAVPGAMLVPLYAFLITAMLVLTVGLVLGLPGLLAGLAIWRGGARYWFGLLCAAARGRLPWRLSAFCHWACDAGLLRVSGASYQFRHRELQDWLTRTG